MHLCYTDRNKRSFEHRIYELNLGIKLGSKRRKLVSKVRLTFSTLIPDFGGQILVKFMCVGTRVFRQTVCHVDHYHLVFVDQFAEKVADLHSKLDSKQT